MWQAGQAPIPGYKLEEFVGKGNFGEVWQASSPGGTHCALKFLNLRERQGRKEFRAIQSLKQIRHANLMPFNAMWLLDENQQVVPDDQFEPGHPFMEDTRRQTLVSVPLIPEEEKPKTLVIAMPLAESNLLQLSHTRRAQGQDIPVQDLLIYMMDAARALDYLNAQRHEYAGEIVSVQHGDVKPENLVLLGGSVMLCDFGVARTLGVNSERRGTTLGGSLAYMAPECMSGHSSQHSDQFSLAISYAELRTGRLPFAEASITQLIEDRRRGQLDWEGLLPAEQKVLRRACSVDPDKRFPSNVQMVEALRSAVLGSAPKPTRSTWPIATGLAGLLACAAAVAWFYWQPPTVDVPLPTPPPTQSARDYYGEALGILGRPVISAADLTEAAEKYGAALAAGFPLETPAPQLFGVGENAIGDKHYSIADLRESHLSAVHGPNERILLVGKQGRSLVEPQSNSALNLTLEFESPIAAVHWLDDTHLLVRDCKAQLWRVNLQTQKKDALATGVLRIITSPQAAVGLAASDGNGGPSMIYGLRTNETYQAPVPNLITPLLALDQTGAWGLLVEEFDRDGSVRLFPVLAVAPQTPLEISKAVRTEIEPYCVECLTLGDTSWAIVGGRSNLHVGGLALIALPKPGGTWTADAKSVIYPSAQSATALFEGKGRAVRSMATWVAPNDGSVAWLATGQDVSSGDAITELWQVLSDGTLLHQGIVGQEIAGDSITDLAFDPSGQWLLRGTSYGEVLLTSLSHPQVDFQLMLADVQEAVLQTQLVADKVIVTFVDGSILIWNFHECQMIFQACQASGTPLPRPQASRSHSG
jgi:serine/threonine protein kinase